MRECDENIGCICWTGKRVLVVGMARSGAAAAQLLCDLNAMPVLNDSKDESSFSDKLESLKKLSCEWHLGMDPVLLLDSCDILIISPGVPIDAPVVEEAYQRGIPVVGELEFASQVCEGTLLAVTGTNGKTTTVTLIGDIFTAAGKIAYVTGNVGYPLSAVAQKSRRGDVLITEVSSFQLESITTFHPAIAAVLNVTEDHLNRHGSMQAYAALKSRIFENQNQNDVAILNYDDNICRQMAHDLKSKVTWFSRKEEVQQGAFVRDGQIVMRWEGEERIVCAEEDIRIPGMHNLENALAATVVTYISGTPIPVIRHVLRTFAGVEHRIEFVRELNGIRYINDSKGTNVDSTIKAVETMRLPTVMILGGYDKHVSFDELAACICKSGMIRFIALIGQTAHQIADTLECAGFRNYTISDTLKDAVYSCRKFSDAGFNVLFSPACASFDMFTDYEARGRMFKEIVGKL